MNNTATIFSCTALGREGEDFQPPSRTNRFLAVENQWFYRTREGREIGPYACRSSAEEAAVAFAEFTSRVNSSNLDDLIYIHIDRVCKQANEQSRVPLRDGESAVPRTRHPRIVHRDQQWFFTTREGRSVGPYEAQEEARESAQLFTSFTKNISRTCVDGLIDTMNKNISHG